MNIWTGIILGAIVLGIWALSRISHAAIELVTQLRSRVFKIDISNLTLAVDAIIKNPTNTEINIQYPFIKVLYNGNLLASSDLKTEKIYLMPFSQTPINNIQIPISYLYMAGLAPEVVKKIKDKSYKINLEIEISTRVIFATNNIPYIHRQTISI